MKSQADICQAVANSIEQNIKTAGLHLLVAVSGGVDSMVLLALLDRLAPQRDIKLTAVHLDHMYRADAAIADARLVEDYCQDLGIACHIYRRPIASIAAASGQGFEEIARDTRYRLFRALKLALKADYIVTAHHLDDLAESVLLHLLRGSGIDGLVGIRTCDGDLFRPLLTVSKTQILAFAAAASVPYNEDLSNDDTTFLRNKIRHQLIPQLTEQYNQSLVAQLAQLSDIVRHESDYLAADTRRLFDEIVDCGQAITINRAGYKGAHSARRRRLVRYLFETFAGSLKDLTYQHITMLDNWLIEGKINSQQSLLGLHFLIDRTVVHITKGQVKKAITDATFLRAGVNQIAQFNLHITLSSAPLSDIAQTTVSLYLPKHMSNCQLLLRTRQAGDFIRPKGLAGKKKSIKKLFNEQAVPIIERDRLPLLVCQNEVIWGKGLRPSIYQKRVDDKNETAAFVYIDFIK
ncbi:MAG: tRNA lysidine(34) synthetase TilS [Clostridiales bacterium]|nr:MAG: tRNA lysidine(34) synthetase TilS [Clostridiales bacterium]